MNENMGSHHSLMNKKPKKKSLYPLQHVRRVGLVVVQARQRDVRDGDPRVDLALVDGARRADEQVDVPVGLRQVPVPATSTKFWSMSMYMSAS